MPSKRHLKQSYNGFHSFAHLNLQTRTLQDKVRNISILCICLNLLIILTSQCFLLFNSDGILKNDVVCDTATDSSQQIPEAQNRIRKILTPHPSTTLCSLKHKNAETKEEVNQYQASRMASSSSPEQRPSQKHFSSKTHAIIIGVTLVEVFLDLPVNVVLFIAANSKKRHLLLPWLVFNGIRIVTTIIAICIFVIFVIVGIEHFNQYTNNAEEDTSGVPISSKHVDLRFWKIQGYTNTSTCQCTLKKLAILMKH